MREISEKDLLVINGGGLTLVEALAYSAGIAFSLPGGPLFVGASIGLMVITEYNDYKDGVR